jgi:NADH:ubiquinone oxidoreductase subunit 6 (subunit J)
MLLVIVYVGAVAVLFLFVVMMLNIKTSSLKKGFQTYLPLGLLLATVLFVELTVVIFHPNAKINIAATPASAMEKPQPEKQVVNEIKADLPDAGSTEKTPAAKNGKPGKGKVRKPGNKKDVEKKIEKLEEKMAERNPEKPQAETEQEVPQIKLPENIVLAKTTNAAAIGRVLYTQYILYFQLSGLILLVAMIGAIVLTLRTRNDVRRQKTSQQADRANTIKMVKVQAGKGIE